MKLTQLKPNLKSTALAAGGAIAGGLVGRQVWPNTQAYLYTAAAGAVLGYLAGSLFSSTSATRPANLAYYN